MQVTSARTSCLKSLIDTAAPLIPSLDLLASSDTGMFNDDNVTNKWEPTFQGVADAGSTVRLVTGGRVIGETIAGSDDTDTLSGPIGGLGGAAGDGYGVWSITSAPLNDGVYDIQVQVEDLAGNIAGFDPPELTGATNIDIVIDKIAPNTPFLDLLDDTGVSDQDEITSDNTPDVTMTTTDPNGIFSQLVFQDNLKFRIYDRYESTAEFLLYDSTLDSAVFNLSDPADTLTSETFILETLAQQFFNVSGTNAAVLNGGVLADGVHNLKLEVEDRAGNISEDFLLEVLIDAVNPLGPSVELLASSDTGMFDDDNVTAKWEPTFQGVADAGAVVRMFANGDLVGQTVVGSDVSDVSIGGVGGLGGAPNDGLGLWEITTVPLDEGGYDITLEIEDAVGNITSFDPVLNPLAPDPTIDIVIDKTAPNTPVLDLLDDTGENLADEITSDNTPEVFMTTTDPNIAFAQLLHQDNLKFRIYDRYESNDEFLLYDSALDAAADNTNVVGDMFTSLEGITQTLPNQFFGLFGTNAAVLAGGVLAEGTHNLKLEVEDRAGNISEDFLLEIFVDTVAPTPDTPDLLASSDSGMFDNDNVTNKWQPAFVGVAEINNKVFVYAQEINPATGLPATGDILQIGQGLVGSENSNNLDGDGLGTWEVTVEPMVDGVYDIFVRFEDWAGNFTPIVDALQNTLRVVIDKAAPNTPLLDLRDDTGENLADEITNDNTPDVFMTTTDPNIDLAEVLFQDNLKFRIYDRYENNDEFLLYDSALDPVADASLFAGDMFTSLEGITQTLPNQFFNLFGTNAAVLAGGLLADGTHNLKLEVEDRAGNISEDFLLEVFVDTIPPAAVTPDLLASSDSGMFDDDNVTNKWEPAFTGEAEINNKVFVYAQKINPATGLPLTGDILLIGEGLVGSENSNNIDGDGLGAWEVTVEPLVESVYDIFVRFEDWAGNFTPLADALQNTLRIVIDKTAPNTPYLDLTQDTGRNDLDDITLINTPQVSMTSEDPNIELAQLLFQDNLKFRIYDRFENDAEFLLYDSAQDATVDLTSFAGDMFTSLTFIQEILPQQFFALTGINNAVLAGGVLADGLHNLKLEVEDRAGNISEDFLLSIEVDTIVPPVSFGDPNVLNDGLMADSDTGVLAADPPTLEDRITSDSTPTFWGMAEADSIVRVYADINGNGSVDPGDLLLGQTVATPFDGNKAFADGRWEVTTAIDLNEPSMFANYDGTRNLLVTAEDVAGNVNLPNDGIGDVQQQLDIFVDTQGPRVEGVFVSGSRDYDLFDPKPSTSGPTPLVNALEIDLSDLPDRTAAFFYEAVNAQIVTNPGHYLLVGDHTGVVAIQSITLNDNTVVGGPGLSTITLNFVQPLADDRYTLTLRDTLTDDAGNQLDGESNTIQPQDNPTFPSGDLVPGSDFVARFTIDSRPEVGTFVAQNISIDTNGNYVWDPATGSIGQDATNVDLQFTLPVANPDGSIGQGGYNVSDIAFAGKFGLGFGNLIVGDDAVFIIDVSGSTGGAFGGSPVGDLNNDGIPNTVLDAEIAAFKALNQELINRGLGNTSQVAIVSFSSSATSLDMDPVAPGIQLTTTPLADVNMNGMRDVDEVLMGLNDGGGTNYEAPLSTALNVVNTIGVPNINVIFLSDGAPNTPGAHADEAAALRAQNVNLRAFGVGPAVPLAELQIIDPNAATFANTNELLNVFGGAAGGAVGGVASGFDTLAAYGWSQELNEHRWLVDQNHDGVVSLGLGEIRNTQAILPNFEVKGALPVAGNFDGNLSNGDEIGLYNAGQWAFDTNRNFTIDAGDTFVTNNLFGHPIIGDFDGDGADDAGVFNNNLFTFDFANNGFGSSDQQIVWGYPGVLDRPVAADFDQDGIDDIGLWVPRNSSATPRNQAEWYIKISGGDAPVPGTAVALNHPFTPVPFGNDKYVEFGDDLALPIVGNFDPPVASGGTPVAPVVSQPQPTGSISTASISSSVVMDGDLDANGRIDMADLALWRSSFSTNMAIADANGDGSANSLDYLFIRERMGQTASGFAAAQAPVSTAATMGPAAESSESLPVASFAAFASFGSSSSASTPTPVGPIATARFAEEDELLLVAEEQAVSAGVNAMGPVASPARLERATHGLKVRCSTD